MSGGGYRTDLFHVGALRRLAELDSLARVGRVSSISGASIVAGRLAQVRDDYADDPTSARYDALVATMRALEVATESRPLRKRAQVACELAG